MGSKFMKASTMLSEPVSSQKRSQSHCPPYCWAISTGPPRLSEADRKRLEELRYPKTVVSDVADLVYLHLRFHGYADDAWSDSAEGPFLGSEAVLLQPTTLLHHLLIHATGVPLAIGLSAANTHDSQLLEPTVDAVPAAIGPPANPRQPRHGRTA